MNAKSFLLGIGAAVVLLLSCITCYRYGYKQGRRAPIEVVSDTLTVRDTITCEKPYFVDCVILDTLLIQGDTVRVCDTLYMEVVREQKRYEDTTYCAWVSGVLPELDSIHVYQTTRFITTRVPVIQKQKITFGAQVGFGAQYGLARRGFDCGPYLGFGLNVNF